MVDAGIQPKGINRSFFLSGLVSLFKGILTFVGYIMPVILGLVVIYGIASVEGHLTPNPILYIYFK